MVPEAGQAPGWRLSCTLQSQIGGLLAACAAGGARGSHAAACRPSLVRTEQQPRSNATVFNGSLPAAQGRVRSRSVGVQRKGGRFSGLDERRVACQSASSVLAAQQDLAVRRGAWLQCTQAMQVGSWTPGLPGALNAL